MSKRAILTERLRRVSTPDVFRRPSKVDPALEPLTEQKTYTRSKSVPDISSCSTANPALLFLLPTEVLAQILKHISFADFCAFRLVCHHSSYLVYGGVIVREWAQRHVGKRQLLLQPPPSPPGFMYILEQRRRFLAVSDTANVLAEYIEHEILRHTLRRANTYSEQGKQGMFDVVKAQLKTKMVPLLLTIQHYLENLAAHLLATSTQRQIDEGTDSSDIDDSIFETYGADHLLQVHKCWMFLSWLSNQILSRPSYAGTMERTMRGWLTDPLDHYDFRLFFVFGNVRAIKDLVELPSYKHRRKAVEAWMRGLDPHQNVLWTQNWQKMATKLDEHPDKEQASAALKLKLSADDIWAKGAQAALKKHGLLEEEDDAGIGTPWQTMVRTNVLCGYTHPLDTSDICRIFFAT